MIFTFWEGKKPAYIDLCMETWAFPFTVLNYQNVNQYTDLPIEKIKRFTLPQIADCVRVHVLRDQGGVWLDADTITITGQLPKQIVLGNNKARTNTIGFLRADKEMFTQWAAFQDEIINGNETPTHWATFGNAFTDKYLKEHDIEIGDISEHWPEMGPGDRWQRYIDFYFNSSYGLKDIKTDVLMLHNSWTPGWFKNLSRNEVLLHGCTLSNILRDLL